jgi:hypothetical protein
MEQVLYQLSTSADTCKVFSIDDLAEPGYYCVLFLHSFAGLAHQDANESLNSLVEGNAIDKLAHR